MSNAEEQFDNLFLDLSKKEFEKSKKRKPSNKKEDLEELKEIFNKKITNFKTLKNV